MSILQFELEARPVAEDDMVRFRLAEAELEYDSLPSFLMAVEDMPSTWQSVFTQLMVGDSVRLKIEEQSMLADMGLRDRQHSDGHAFFDLSIIDAVDKKEWLLDREADLSYKRGIEDEQIEDYLSLVMADTAFHPWLERAFLRKTHILGASVEKGGEYAVHYRGQLLDGQVVDASPVEGIWYRKGMQGQLIPGLESLANMISAGDTLDVILPCELAFGMDGAKGVVPPWTALHYTIWR